MVSVSVSVSERRVEAKGVSKKKREPARLSDLAPPPPLLPMAVPPSPPTANWQVGKMFPELPDGQGTSGNSQLQLAGRRKEAGENSPCPNAGAQMLPSIFSKVQFY